MNIKRLIAWVMTSVFLMGSAVNAQSYYENEYPVNPMITRGECELILSWKNPEFLSKIQIDNITDNTVVTDSLPTQSGYVVTSTVKGLTNDKEYLFKISFTYINQEVKEIYLSERPQSFTPRVAGPWVLVNNSFAAKLYIDRQQHIEGTSSIRVSQNKNEIKNGQYSLLYVETPIEAGTYHISAKVKAKNASGVSMYFGGWSRYTQLTGNTPETYDWKEFSDTITVTSKTSPMMFLVMSGYCESLWIDDIVLHRVVNGVEENTNLYKSAKAESIENLLGLVNVPDIKAIGANNSAEIIWNKYDLEGCLINVYDKNSGCLVASVPSTTNSISFKGLTNSKNYEYVIKTENYYFTESNEKTLSVTPKSQMCVRINPLEEYNISSVNVLDRKFEICGQSDLLCADDVVTMTVWDSNDDIAGMDEVKCDDKGKFVFDFFLDDGLYTMYINSKIGKKYTYLVVSDYCKTVEEVSKMGDNLKLYLDMCADKGISTDYEKISYRIIEQSEEFFKQDNQYGYSGYREEEIKQLTDLYCDAVLELKSYIDGDKKSKHVARYETSERTYDKNTFFANSTDGVRPTYFVGYASDAENVEVMYDLGVNYIHNEVLLEDVLVRGAAPHWTLYGTGNCSVEANGLNVTNTADVSIGQYVKLEPKTKYSLGGTITGNQSKCTLSIGDKKFNISSNSAFSFDYVTGDNGIVEFKITMGAGSGKLSGLYVKRAGSDVNILENADFSDNDALYNVYGYTTSMKRVYEYSDFLKKAEADNIAVCLNFGIHYIPSVIKSDDSSAANGRTPTPTHPRYLNAVEIYARDFLGYVGNSKALADVVIYNEPVCDASNFTYYKPEWTEFLKNKYGTISKLNQAYSTSYKSFEEVDMPKTDYWKKNYTDFIEFNDKVMSDMHHLVSGYIKNYTNAQVHTKIMQYLRPYSGDERLNKSNNYDMWQDAFDVNGCDAFSCYSDEQFIPIYAKMAWYDYMNSVKPATAINSEDHILPDAENVTYSEYDSKHIVADIWQGAIHRRGGSTLWLYDRKPYYLYFDKSLLNSNLTVRPTDQYNIGKTALDINRLSKEIYTVANTDADIAVMYSQNSLARDNFHMHMVCEAYRSVLTSGQKCEFITDMNFDKLSKYKLIILPGTSRISNELFGKLSEYVNNGGKLCIIGDDAVRYDEFDNKRSATTVDALRKKADYKAMYIGTFYLSSSQVSQLEAFVKSSIAKAVQPIVTAEDVNTNTALNDVEYLYAEDANSGYISLCNYSKDEKLIRLYKEDGLITEGYEMISGKWIDDTVKLEPYGVMLIKTDKTKCDITIQKKENGEYKQKDKLSQGAWKVQFNFDYIPQNAKIIVAKYKGEQLTGVAINNSQDGDVELNVTEEDDKIKCMVWDIKNVYPYITEKILSK